MPQAESALYLMLDPRFIQERLSSLSLPQFSLKAVMP